MSINFRLHAILWGSSAKQKAPSPASIRHTKYSFSFEINLIIRYAKGSNCKLQFPITLCHSQLLLTDTGPGMSIQEGLRLGEHAWWFPPCFLPQLIHSVASEKALRHHSVFSVSQTSSVSSPKYEKLSLQEPYSRQRLPAPQVSSLFHWSLRLLEPGKHCLHFLSFRLTSHSWK